MESHVSKSVSAPCTPTEQSRIAHNGSVKKKTKRPRVHFPVEEFLVTCFLDPPDPWSKGLLLSVDTVITAYTAACEVQGIQPLSCVLDQLQEYQSNARKVDSIHRTFDLSLVGEKLSGKHCEALEEVLRRVKFYTIDLEGCSMEDEGAAALFDMIEYYDSAVQLNISFVKNVDCQGWQACSRMLKKTNALLHLNARSTALNEQVLLILGKALRLGSNLTTLHLENCGICGRCLVILVAALKSNTTLRELFLAENKVSSSDGFQLGNLLRTNTHLELLDLSNNGLQDEGLTHVMESLGQQSNTSGRGLSTLSLWNNKLTVHGMPCVAKALNSARTLKRFNLGSNSVTSAGIKELKQSFICNQTLEALELEDSKITAEGAFALADYISQNSIIQKIDLRGNDIALCGIKSLSKAMLNNHSVISLQVDHTAMDLEEPIKERMNEIQLINQYCSRNKEENRFKPAQDIYLSTLFNGIFSRVLPSSALITSEEEEKTYQFSQLMTRNKDIQKGRFQVSPVNLDEQKKSKQFIYNSGNMKNVDRYVSSPTSLELELSSTLGANDSAGMSEMISNAYMKQTGNMFVSTSGRKISNELSDCDAAEKDDDDVFVNMVEKEGKNESYLQFKRRHSDVPMYYSQIFQDSSVSESVKMNGKEQVAVDDGCEEVNKTVGKRVAKRKDLVLSLKSQNSSDLPQVESKERRLSSPTVNTEPHVFRKVHSIKCCKTLESLDLCSSMPLSPTKLYENFSFPQPAVVEVPCVSSDTSQSTYMIH